MNKWTKTTIRFHGQVIADGEQGKAGNVKANAAERAIEKAQRTKAQLAAEYGVLTSSIVWCGDSRYIIVKDGKEIKISCAYEQQ